MVKNLDSIPYDVFYQVASRLDCHDYIHLSRVNRPINVLMKNDSMARNTVRSELLHTKEGREADQAKTGYCEALGRLYDIKESFATAEPYSAVILGYGSSFLYAGGSLCYIYNDEIRALDVQGASRVEQVLNLPKVIRKALRNSNLDTGRIRVSLMNYSEWVVAFLVEVDDARDSWLLAVDLKRQSNYEKSGRLRMRAHLDSTERLFDHLYAISTLVDFEEEEVDWTSYYVWMCLPPSLKISKTAQQPFQTWRRQHREGPINDTWSDLSLREDEATGQLMILECRREWRDGGSENCRTYYVQPLPGPHDIGKQQPESDYYLTPTLPDEPLTKTLDEYSKPHYERPRKRLRRHYHPEYDGGVEPKPRRDFILARTKFRTYNPSASSYLDLVNDPLPGRTGGGGDLVPRDRIRLRVVSRKRKCPIDEDGVEEQAGFLFKPELSEADGRLVENSEERFVPRGMYLWPPDSAPQELNHLLCPSKRTGQIQAMADDRSIVYSVNQDGLQADNQALILISFDPLLRLPGLQRLSLGTQPEKTKTAIGIKRPQVGDIGQERAAIHTTLEGNTTNQNMPSVREERAMYLDISRGFWLR
ncbi:hypothetical protein P175DRAFT_0435347 [Aspergillus ochraceoroseus IBT 24754]|uniref:F-box domain-containing protein n=1 Tax=Aspergillus ochraceoroseus IBT 24754 TaxID=1392256 RepID=A0A2T5LZ22_9EURO|nr:uncharacterized protein P175DRAFT_0435347 [Aspergillus ochraceoroseus IBT 24754]PTU21535.1 hypothetical protein P175DRAFT_0435347 [Aspergillus ochraceoroseus IBT 24754]